MTATAEVNVDKKIDTIAKLLAKAESSEYPAEAEAFTEQAERMMIRYGIEKATIDDTMGKLGLQQEPIIKDHIDLTGVYRVGRMASFSNVVHAFNSVTPIRQSGPRNERMYLVGAKSDVEQVKRLLESLVIQGDVAMKAWWATEKDTKGWMTAAEKTKERRQFLISFGFQVAERIAAIYGEESDGKELVLVGRKNRAEEAVPGFFPQVRNARKSRLQGGSRAAGLAGRQAGTRANVNPNLGARGSAAINA
jgi:hypothetical protein